MTELKGGNVHAYTQFGRKPGRLVPSDQLPTCFRQHPLPDRHDQSCLFRQLDEITRGNSPSPRVVPAQERLDSFQSTALQVDDRLVEQDEFSTGYGGTK